MSTPRAGRRRYHHGDLRNALILAAAALIEEGGSTEFSLADAARRAGVSTAAPYRHFRDREALLEAVALLGFMGFSRECRHALDSAPAGSEEAILALGRTYISFLERHRPFFDLMWGPIGQRAVGDGLAPEESGFAVLVEAVGAFCRARGMDDADAVVVANELWAMVHGLSTLSMHGLLNRFQADADAFAMLGHATGIFLRGLVNGADR